MTICVAAICQGTTIFGASDRMLTSGDIQFEPVQTKIISVTNSIAIMTAGDASLQSEIAQKILADVAKRIEVAPTVWTPIGELAEMYSRFYHEARLKRTEREFLAPLGLDSDTFLQRQKELDSQFIRQLATELINYSAPQIEAVICGLDSTGAHIYVASNVDGPLRITCQDSVGFATIGIGGWHASSQLMFAGHTRHAPYAETLLRVYSAKKHAEVAPGVGKDTDMFTIGPQLGSYFDIGEAIKQGLQGMYVKQQKAIIKASKQSDVEVTNYVAALSGQTTPKPQTTEASQDSGGNPSPDEKELRGNVEESKPADN